MGREKSKFNEQFSEKYTSISIEKNVINSECERSSKDCMVRWYQYLLIKLCYTFVRKIKQHMFYSWLRRYKSNTLINNHFIIKYKVDGTCIWSSGAGLRRLVPWYSKTSLFFNVTFYTLMHFWLGKQKLMPS